MQQGSPYPQAMAPGWSGMDDATLDAVIMDPAASAAQKAAAAAAKRSRSVMRVAQPTMERMGNDLSRVADMAKDGYSRMMGGGEDAPPDRLPRGNVQDPLAGTVMRAPPPMSGEFPVERPDMAAIAGSVPPALLAQSAARAQPPGPVDDIQAGANAAKAVATPPPTPTAAPGGPDDMGNMSPSFLEMAKKFVDAQEESPLTAEDKWLALARAGFGMAASNAPSFGQALGEGAMAGITQLQQVRAQRAEQAARRAQMGLQVAGTEAQLRQGDRNYQLAQQREAREREQGAEKNKTDRLTAEANAKRDEAYIKSLNRGDLSTDDKGNAIIIDRNTGRAKPVLDDSGNPIKATKFASSASARTASTKVGIVRETLRSELGREPTVDEMANGLDKFNRLSPDRKRIALYGVAGKLGIDKNEVADIADYLDQEMDSGATAPDAEPAAAPATPSGVKSQLPPKEVEKVLANARKAIANGKSKEAVIKRLRDSGIDPSGL